MFQTYESAFEKHGVLRAGALNEGLNGAIRTMEQLYAGYSDGILKDITIDHEGDNIVLKSGVVRFQGRIYYLDKEIQVNLHQNNKKDILKLRFLEVQYKDGLKKWTTDVVLDENEIIRNNEIELCRFQYQPGAKLRTTYSDFRDYSAAYNIVNILYAPYAALEESSISPQITKRFSEELMQSELKDPYDVAFGFECQRGGVVSRKSILNYIKHKLHIRDSNISNYDIYTYLSRILESNGPNGNVERPRMREQRRIII